MPDYLTITIRKKYEANIKKGVPWAPRTEIIGNSGLETAIPGELVKIVSLSGKFLGVGYYNPKSYIACRVLTRDPNEKIGIDFFSSRIMAAIDKREKLYPGGPGKHYYRLIHSEADGLPGLIIDRFGDLAVCQISTAGMERLKGFLIAALEKTIAPKAIIFRNDIPVRLKEGLKNYVSVEKQEAPIIQEVHENGAIYFADLLHGQKTGWFYDQRDNRKFIAGLAKGKSVLDCYCYNGGFGMLAAKNGAGSVTFVDSSARALELAGLAAKENSVEDCCRFIRAKAFDALEGFRKSGEKFDIVLLDPPAFVKTKADKRNGFMGYSRLADLGVSLVNEGGIFALTSCSHHAGRAELRKLLENSIKKSGREFILLKSAGAAPDHPAHPLLPENDYLKFFAFRLD